MNAPSETMSEETNIGRYQIKGLIGQGAMGSVFKAFDPNLHRSVAIKTMRTAALKDSADFEEFKERFFQEARVNGRLNHPNIVSVYDSGIHGKEPYLVMEFIAGKPLDKFIAEHGETRYPHLLTLARQIAMGLDLAHEEEIIHRDIKPGNILVAVSRTKKFRAKIVDFGLARLRDSKLTQSGLFLGTPSYASPEQIMTGRVDSRSDVYSFGTVVYEMLSGTLPFEAESLHAIMYQIANEPPKMCFDNLPAVVDKQALAEVFERLFQKKPDDRHQTAAELIEDLEPLLKPLKVVDETVLTQDLRRQKVTPTPPATPAVDPKTSEHIRRIERMRAQFKQAFTTGNISAVRYCLQELKGMGADTAEEETSLKRLESQNQESEAQSRVKQVRQARSEFKMALKTGNISSIRYCLSELEKLDPNVGDEREELARLEAALKAEAERNQRIESLRTRFQDAVGGKDPDACRQVIKSLLAEGWDITAESKSLKALETRLEKEAKQRQSWVGKTRTSFQTALNQKDWDKCRHAIKELETLLKVDASAEKQALSDAEAAELGAGIVRNLRTQFKAALSDMNLKRCEQLLKELQDLNEDVEEESRNTTRLKAQLRQQKARELKENMIRHTRENFYKALKTENLDNCRYYLRELRQLDRDTAAEEEALASLEADIRDRDANRLKEQMILHVRENFQAALARQNVDNCRYYLRELQQLGVVVQDEERQLAQLELDQKNETTLRHNMINNARDQFFQQLEAGDADRADHFIGVLRELKADIRGERRFLERLKRKGFAFTDDTDRIERYRYEFVEAFREQQLPACTYYLEKLKGLNADVGSEQEAANLLAAKLRA